MKPMLAAVGIAFTLGAALPAAAQTTSGKAGAAPAKGSAYERAKKRCQENRGTDCESREGLKPWIVEETPMSKQQQQSGAAARHRRDCAASKNKPGC